MKRSPALVASVQHGGGHTTLWQVEPLPHLRDVVIWTLCVALAVLATLPLVLSALSRAESTSRNETGRKVALQLGFPEPLLSIEWRESHAVAGPRRVRVHLALLANATALASLYGCIALGGLAMHRRRFGLRTAFLLFTFAGTFVCLGRVTFGFWAAVALTVLGICPP